jgi:hypothetical protein
MVVITLLPIPASVSQLGLLALGILAGRATVG